MLREVGSDTYMNNLYEARIGAISSDSCVPPAFGKYSNTRNIEPVAWDYIRVSEDDGCGDMTAGWERMRHGTRTIAYSKLRSGGRSRDDRASGVRRGVQ